MARLLVDNIPTIQVDWSLCRPKLAQVALTVGADDVDGVSPEEDRTEAAGERRSKRFGETSARPAKNQSNENGRFEADRAMTRVRLGAVSYSNARPCVVGLDHHPRFNLRFDIPSRCAALLHEGAIDVGLIPTIEYLRGASRSEPYQIVPNVAIASFGPVASVALYTKRPVSDIRSIALDTSFADVGCSDSGALRKCVSNQSLTRSEWP